MGKDGYVGEGWGRLGEKWVNWGRFLEVLGWKGNVKNLRGAAELGKTEEIWEGWGSWVLGSEKLGEAWGMLS